MARYEVETNGTHFELENCDDAMNLVSMLAEYGKVEKREYGKDLEVVKSTIIPMSVTLTRMIEEVGLNE